MRQRWLRTINAQVAIEDWDKWGVEVFPTAAVGCSRVFLGAGIGIMGLGKRLGASLLWYAARHDHRLPDWAFLGEDLPRWWKRWQEWDDTRRHGEDIVTPAAKSLIATLGSK